MITLTIILGVIVVSITALMISESTITVKKEKDGELKISINKEPYELNGLDGPYLIDSTYYFVDEKNEIKSQKFNDKDSLLVQVDNPEKDFFYVHINDSTKISNSVFEMPEKLIAISDIEGNFEAFSSFLKANKVIDEKFNWIFGNGHLILNGDFVDRGQNVTQVLWLIYKIENEAKKSGGEVHYVLGNHELLNFQGSYKYNNHKYDEVSKLIYEKQDQSYLSLTTQSDYVKYIYSNKTEIGKWLNSKNGMIKIGNYVFVHGGISPEILKYNLSISRINEISRENLNSDLYNNPKGDGEANFIIGRKGIFWFRGLATDYKYYDKIDEIELDNVLKKFNASKIVHGHTPVDDITKSFNGKVINIDVKHGDYSNLQNTKGILIENGTEYKIDAKGNKSKI